MSGIKKQVLQVSVSGGATSMCMGYLLKKNYSHLYDFIFTFANTGREDEKTLKFIKMCDDLLEFNTVWLEAVVDPRPRKGTKHKIVTYETATRGDDIFIDMFKKFGIPNKAYPHCTRELKLRPMQSYLRSIGLKPRNIKVALGIRTDETRRVSKKAGFKGIIYPMIDMFPMDKEDVKIFWEGMPFQLGLEEHQGNCKGCFKKSFVKLFRQIDEDPKLMVFFDQMEKEFGHIKKKPGHVDRVFFRNNTSAAMLQKIYLEDRKSDNPTMRIEDGGCSESCEFLPMN